jgi:hypothetical protein
MPRWAQASAFTSGRSLLKLTVLRGLFYKRASFEHCRLSVDRSALVDWLVAHYSRHRQVRNKRCMNQWHSIGRKFMQKINHLMPSLALNRCMFLAGSENCRYEGLAPGHLTTHSP